MIRKLVLVPFQLVQPSNVVAVFDEPLSRRRSRFSAQLVGTALALLLGVWFSPVVQAQCAMCRTALQSSPEGQAMAAGFNQAILFLLAAPFLIVLVVATIIVRSQTRGAATDLRTYSGSSYSASRAQRNPMLL
jgi:ABC-type multidrug transport system permease subunit